MPELDRGAALMALFEARRYDLASKSDRKTMAAVINEAFQVTETAERERCAKFVEGMDDGPITTKAVKAYVGAAVRRESKT